jgi:arylsulfatase A-like enzyme
MKELTMKQLSYAACCAALLAAGLLLPQNCTAAEAAKQPNLVLIFCDDLASAALSAYGDSRKLLATPNIDRIAKEGMRFDRCLVPNSICGPSRAVVQTGKYNHLNGFFRNGNTLDGSQQTFPKLLQKAGYQTAVVGKWHLESDPQGFDYWHILPGQGVYYNPPMKEMGKQVKHEGYTTDLITDFTINWLKNRDKDKPFLMMMQHKAPHREWSPALRHLNHDNDRQYPEPKTLFDDYAGRGKAEHQQDMTIEKTMNDLDVKLNTPRSLNDEQRKKWDEYYEPRNKKFRDANLQGKDLVRWKYNRYMHDYLGCVKAVDESVGRLLDYLDEEKLADNTVVIFASDQGFYLGEHGWFDKRWIFEESVTTPCMARWPGVTKAGSTNKDIVSVLDFAETFLDAAGAKIPDDMQGRSLRPVLAGQTPSDWRKSFYYHYYEFPGAHSVRKHYGVVTDRYKLVYFYEPDMNYWELFDLQTDPLEMKSVYDDAKYAQTRQDLEKELARLRKELKVPEQDPPQSLTPRRPMQRRRPAQSTK